MMVSRYQKRISGPLLDRIDIHVEVPRVDYEKLADDRLGEPSARIRERVERARAIQRQRFAGTPLATNADTPARAPQAHVWGRPKCSSIVPSLRAPPARTCSRLP